MVFVTFFNQVFKKKIKAQIRNVGHQLVTTYKNKPAKEQGRAGQQSKLSLSILTSNIFID